MKCNLLAWIAPLPQQLAGAWVPGVLEISESDQQSLRNSLTEAEKAESLAELLKTYTEALPPVEWSADGWQRWRTLAPHLDAYLVHLKGHPLETEAILLMYQYARWLIAVGSPEPAVAILKRARMVAPQHGQPSQYELAGKLAMALRHIGDVPAAESLYRQLLEASSNDGTVMNNLAVLLIHKDEVAEAEQLLVRSIELKESEDGPESPHLIPSLNHLGEIYQETDRLDRALELNQRALGLARKQKLYDTVARCATYLAMTHQAREEYAETEELLIEAKDFFSTVLGEAHSETIAILVTLAINYQLKDEGDKGLETLSGAIESIEKIEPDGKSVCRLLQARADYLTTEGDITSATSDLTRGLALQQKILGENHPNNWAPIMKLAGLYDELDDDEQSEFWYLRAVDLAEKSLSDLQIAEAADRAAQIRAFSMDNKDPVMTATLFQRSVDILVNHPEKAPWLRRIYLDFASLVFSPNKDPDKGIALAQASLEISARLKEEASEEAAEGHRYLAEFYSEKGERSQAEKCWRRYIEIRREHKTDPNTFPDLLRAIRKLADVLIEAGEFGEAETLYKRALQGSEIVYSDRPKRQQAEKGISLLGYSRLLKAMGRVEEAAEKEKLGREYLDRLTRD